MSEQCEECKELQDKLDALQERYDVLYEAVDNCVYDARRVLDELAKEL